MAPPWEGLGVLCPICMSFVAYAVDLVGGSHMGAFGPFPQTFVLSWPTFGPF